MFLFLPDIRLYKDKVLCLFHTSALHIIGPQQIFVEWTKMNHKTLLNLKKQKGRTGYWNRDLSIRDFLKWAKVKGPPHCGDITRGSWGNKCPNLLSFFLLISCLGRIGWFQSEAREQDNLLMQPRHLVFWGMEQDTEEWWVDLEGERKKSKLISLIPHHRLLGFIQVKS